MWQRGGWSALLYLDHYVLPIDQLHTSMSTSFAEAAKVQPTCSAANGQSDQQSCCATHCRARLHHQSKFCVKGFSFYLVQTHSICTKLAPSKVIGLVSVGRSQGGTCSGGEWGQVGESGGQGIRGHYCAAHIPQLSHSQPGPVGTGAVSTA